MLTLMRAIICCAALSASLCAEIVQREGDGYLEHLQPSEGLQVRVLHLKGTPYEMGFQHGKLCKALIESNVADFIDKPQPALKERIELFQRSLSHLISFIPERFQEEMRGLSEGSGIELSKIIALNTFPELIHCSGITVSDAAARDGELYHARVLDYAVGKNLQNTAVLMAVQPNENHAFVNVSYAGFIGSVTGMNDQQIAMGEIGGWGYGHWNGVPMPFLFRDVLERASTLEEAQKLLCDMSRTCEYYYVISDGKSKASIGVYATESQIHFFKPGTTYALLAPKNLPVNYGTNGDHDKFCLPECIMESSSYQSLLFDSGKRLSCLYHKQPPHCLLLTGFAYPERYPLLVERVLSFYGKIDEKALQEIITCPVARNTNLHNAIFMPSHLKLWVSHSGANGEPACNQPYTVFSFSDLDLLGH